MPLFTYTARDEFGNEQEGSIEAVSLQAARDAISELALTIEHIEEGEQSLPPMDIGFATPSSAELGSEPFSLI